MNSSKFNRVIPLLFGCIGMVLVTGLAGNFGLAWDDGLQAFYGEYVLDFYLSLGEDRTFLELHNLFLYGAVFELFSAMVHRVAGTEDIFQFRQLITGITALLVAVLTYKLVRKSFGIGIALFSCAFLFTLPPFFGEAFVNSKDIPFAAAYAAAWLSYLHWVRKGMKFDGWILIPAITIGLGLALRIASLPFVMFIFLVGLLWYLSSNGTEGLKWPAKVLRFPWLHHAFIFSIAWIFMVLTWPTALLAPLSNPIKAFFAFLDFRWEIFVFFLGEWRTSETLPPCAFALLQSLAQPLWCIPFYALGCWELARRWKTGEEDKRLECLALIFWILPLWLIYPFAPFSLYNGVRQTIFLFPAYAWLAGYGLYGLSRILPAYRRESWSLAAGSLCIVLNLILIVHYFPIVYPYKNIIAEYLPGGREGFDADYHALSYRLAAEYMNRLSMEAVLDGRPPPTVLVLAEEHSVMSYGRFSKFPDQTFYTSSLNEDKYRTFEYFIALHPFERKPQIIEAFGLDKRRVVREIMSSSQVYCLIYR